MFYGYCFIFIESGIRWCGMTKEKIIMVDGSVTCGKTLYLKKKAEYLRKQGRKVFVVNEKEDGDVE